MPFFTRPVPIVDDNQTITFGISLYSDGRITFKYDYLVNYELLINIFENATSVSQFGDFISGLRPPVVQSTRPKLVIYTAEQVENGLNVWNTSKEGIYPPTRNLTSDSTFTVCPISTTWMLTPSDININTINVIDGNVNITRISLKPLSIGCFYNNTISIGVYITTTDVGFNTDENGYFVSEGINTTDSNAMGVNSSVLITDCVYTTVDGGTLELLLNDNGEDVYISCNVTTSQLLSGTASVDADTNTVIDRYIGIAWQQGSVNPDQGSVDVYYTLPIPMLALSIYNTTETVTSNNYLNCSVNTPSAISTLSYIQTWTWSVDNTSVRVTAECSLYHGNITELNLTCPLPLSDTPDISDISGISDTYSALYEPVSCSGACDEYSYDNSFTCCDSSEIDCSGACDGNAKYDLYTIGTNDINNLKYCCSNVDACNVCNGTDWSGDSCNTIILKIIPLPLPLLIVIVIVVVMPPLITSYLPLSIIIQYIV